MKREVYLSPEVSEKISNVILINHKKYLTMEELAEYLNVSLSWLNKNWVKYYSKAIAKHEPKSKKILFYREKIDRIIEIFSKSWTL